LKLLLDTQLLLWAAYTPERLSPAARAMIEDLGNELAFSPASLWEVVIKRALGRPDFRIDPRLLRRGLVGNGYVELAVTSDHVLAVDLLPQLHKDPFDRLLVAQALAEGLSFVTADAQLSAYPGDVRLV
jgi:PIN domain nuclease of toxin-antitoxin system